MAVGSFMTVMNKKKTKARTSLGSTTSSSNSSMMSLLEQRDNEATSRLHQAELQLFRFFDLPVPLEHPCHQHQQQQPQEDQQQQSNHVGTEQAEETTPPKKKWWQHHQQQSPAVDEEAPRSQYFTARTSSQVSSAASSYPLPPPPSTWPQSPVWIRASPRSGTQIVGIRHLPGDLPEDFHDQYPDLVPVNAGCEDRGHAIVVDFVSPHFVGSLLIRIRGVPSLLDNSSSHQDYFGTRQRTFQGVVRGRFRRPQPVYDCLSGQTFRRPAGKLPANWIVKAFQALLARLAPHNSLILEGPKPRSLAPLVSTTQTILVTPLSDNDNNTTSSNEQSPQADQGLVLHEGHFFYDSVYDDSINHCYTCNDVTTMEQEFEEPHATHSHSLIHQSTSQLSPEDLLKVSPPRHDESAKNRKYRKRYFNRLLTKWKKKQLRIKKLQQNGHHHDHHQHDVDDDDDHDDDDDNHHHDHHHDHQEDDAPLPDFCFQTDRQYTFEFFENLVMFDNPKKEFAMNLRLPFLRHIPIAPSTNGQPIQMMAAIPKRAKEEHHDASNDDETSGWDDELDYLWAFEVWHESLYEYACKAHA